VVGPIKSGAAGSHLGGAAMVMNFTQRKSPRSSAGGPLIPDELLMIDASPSVRVGPQAAVARSFNAREIDLTFNLELLRRLGQSESYEQGARLLSSGGNKKPLDDREIIGV
jgi:hypothetical protein